MRIRKPKKDWKAIQTLYDTGISWREVMELIPFAWKSLLRAIERGDIISRNQIEAQKLRIITKSTYKHTKETKHKLSEIRTNYLKNNPDKVPYKLNHYSKGNSYPENYFIELFKKENIPLLFHKDIGIYELDFYNEQKKIVIEIDGEQHYADQRIVESDIRRTEYLNELGWLIYRIRWSEYQRKSYEEKSKIISHIKNLLDIVKELHD